MQNYLYLTQSSLRFIHNYSVVFKDHLDLVGFNLSLPKYCLKKKFKKRKKRVFNLSFLETK